MSYRELHELPNELLNRMIARRLGWRVVRKARRHFITLNKGVKVHGHAFRRGDFSRRDGWLAALDNTGCWADDLNVAAGLFAYTGRECDLCYTLIQLDMHYDTWVWQAMIGLDHEDDEIPYEAMADDPARAICIAWLRWFGQGRDLT